MKIVLVSGVRHKTYIKYISKYTPVNTKVNLEVDSLKDYLQHYGATTDCVLITDGGLLCNPSDNVRIIQEILEDVAFEGICFVVLTHDVYLKNELARLKNANVLYTAFPRIIETDIIDALKFVPEAETKRKDIKINNKNPHDDMWPSTYEKEEADQVAAFEDNKSKNKRRAFGIGGIKNKVKSADDDFSNISRAHSRSIAFTGRAGAGVTGSVMNIAYSAAKKGMRVIVLDLDTEYRTSNLYLNKFCTMAEESEDICRSLIKTLANPKSYMETAVSITDSYWVASLGYDFNDKQAMDNFFTEQKIAALVSALKNKFDYVFADISLRVLSRIPGVMMHFDNFALCVENNLYSAVTTLRTLINDFNSEDIRYLNLKSKLIVTKYNDESMYDDEILTPDRLADLMTDNMCDDFVDDLQIAGEIPYVLDFDRQIESDIPIYETNALLKESYDKILARL